MSGQEQAWHVWKRWCSVCGQLKAHVYAEGCSAVECSCGAWLQVPALSIIEAQDATVDRLITECVAWRRAETGDRWTGQVQRVMEAIDALEYPAPAGQGGGS